MQREELSAHSVRQRIVPGRREVHRSDGAQQLGQARSEGAFDARERARRVVARGASARITRESYTAALRGLTAPNDLLSASRRALRPGTVTAFISGGGASNVAVPLPTFGQLLANGHGMVHTTAGRDGWQTLPNDFDDQPSSGVGRSQRPVTMSA